MPLRTKLAAIALLCLLGSAGCSQDSPKTYPVSGKVSLAGGDVQQLAGHHVEAVLESDPAVRASGIIGPDGCFSLETLYAGVILKGAREGRYQVRIIRGDENDEGKKLKKPPVAARFLQFRTSGLSLEVPTPSDVSLEIQSR